MSDRDAVVPVVYGQPNLGADTGQASQDGVKPFEEVVVALRREIGAAGLKLLNEIDPQAAVEGFGHRMGGARLLFFFHPELVAKLVGMDWTAIVEAPLKLAVVETPGGATSVRWADPAVTFARYGNPAVAAFGQGLAEMCRRIVAASLAADLAG